MQKYDLQNEIYDIYWNSAYPCTDILQKIITIFVDMKMTLFYTKHAPKKYIYMETYYKNMN